MDPTSPLTEFLTDRAIYERVIQDLVPRARSFLWIATADLKDLHVHGRSGMMPFLGALSELADAGVDIRLLHAKEPGPAFRRDFDRYPNLIDGMEMLLCPRVHFKSVIMDAEAAYAGSANLTGAGMGAKGVHRRNFEHGFLTRDPALVSAMMAQFDGVWMGSHCAPCGRKKYCAAYLELLQQREG